MSSRDSQSAPSTVVSQPDPGVRADAGEDLDEALRVFLAERTRLMRVAFRVVGDVAEAEDVVQEAWLRWQRVDRREIRNPAAFLTTATTHLAINLVQTARHRHETPVDLPRDTAALMQDATSLAERAIAVEGLLGFLMAKLTSSELAAFVLRNSFDYPYQAISGVLQTTESNARQLVRRSHLSIAGGRAYRVDVEARRRLVAAFVAATTTGELNGLERLLVEHARQSRRCPAASSAGNGHRRHRGTTAVTDWSADRSGSSRTLHETSAAGPMNGYE